MLFEMSDRAKLIEDQILRFMDEHVYPAERVYAQQVEESGDPHFEPPVMIEMPPATMPLAPSMPMPKSAMCMDPPLPLQ